MPAGRDRCRRGVRWQRAAAAAVKINNRRTAVIASVRLAGEQETSVRAVTTPASRAGHGQIAIRLGRVLLYVEDRVALDAIIRTIRTAETHADAVYGERRDAFTLTEARARRQFEKGRRPRP